MKRDYSRASLVQVVELSITWHGINFTSAHLLYLPAKQLPNDIPTPGYPTHVSDNILTHSLNSLPVYLK